MSPKKVAAPLDLYIRVSDVRGRAGESFISPKDQEERCRALAKARGYRVGEVFTDLDISGGKMTRPELTKAITRIRDGVSGGIIVAKLDRFARTLVGGLQTLEEINELGGVVIVADGEFDTSTATGELVLNMMLSLAQFELRRIRENWSTAKKHAVENGIHITRHVPPGYDRGDDRRLVTHAKHGKTITEAFKLAASGEPYADIAAYLNERSLPSAGREGIWQPNRIKRLLENRVYLGEARSGHGHANPNAHAALVDPATWTLAQRRAASSPGRGRKPQTLLAGLCRCAGCSHAMRSQPARGTTVAAYRCATTTVHGRCPSPSTISLTRLEEHVLEQFLGRVAELRLHQVDTEDDTNELATAAADAEASYRDALTNVELRQRIGAADHDRMVAALHEAWQDAVVAIPEAVAPAREPLAEVEVAELVDELRRRDDTASLRELLGAEIQAVFVRPAASRARNLPIEDRVRIVWRDEEPLELPRRGERFEPRSFVW